MSRRQQRREYRLDDDDYDYDEDGYDKHDKHDDRILMWLPASGIDFDVIAADLKLYLDSEATVERGNHPNVLHICEMDLSPLILSRIIAQAIL